jgi:hypothetical protein
LSPHDLYFLLCCIYYKLLITGYAADKEKFASAPLLLAASTMALIACAQWPPQPTINVRIAINNDDDWASWRARNLHAEKLTLRPRMVFPAKWQHREIRAAADSDFPEDAIRMRIVEELVDLLLRADAKAHCASPVRVRRATKDVGGADIAPMVKILQECR